METLIENALKVCALQQLKSYEVSKGAHMDIDYVNRLESSIQAILNKVG